MIKGQFSREGWKTVRVAMVSWGSTARFVIIMLAVVIPTFGFALLARLTF